MWAMLTAVVTSHKITDVQMVRFMAKLSKFAFITVF